MTPKEIITLVRNACGVINATPTIEAEIDLEREDNAIIADFIALCKGIPEDQNVPETVSTAWDAIPDEWLEGKLPEPYNTCSSFGKQSARSKACKRCQKDNIDEYLRCGKTTEVKRKPTKEPAGTSRYGHILGSKSAFIDDFIVDGINESELIKKMQEKWEDMSTETCINKIRSHIAWLPRVRGVEVVITRLDGDYHYKASVEKWCGSKESVVQVKNVRIDKRTKKLEQEKKKAEKAEKKAEKKAKAEGEKKVKKAKKEVEAIKKEKPAGKTSKVSKPVAESAEPVEEQTEDTDE